MPPAVTTPRLRLVRNVDGGSFLESFLVAAVASVLGIRFYLELTNYPQIGGGGLHIAHMLWGGLLMLAAIVLLLAFLGRWLQHLAAVVAGIGFGTFIDELGKFITSDNNYFFQPTIALIYATFVLLFLAFRAIERRQALSANERLANAIDLLKDALLDPWPGDKRERALRLLAEGGAEGPVGRSVRMALEQVVPAPALGAGLPEGVTRRARTLYTRLLGLRWFHRLIVGVFLLHALVAVLEVVLIVVGDPRFTVTDPAMDFADWGDSLATVLATGMVLLGVARLRYSRLGAYYWFKRSILVSIFLTEFFAFYQEQLGAITGLAVDLVVLVVLDYMIGEERASGGGPPPAPPPRGEGSTVASVA